mgnify:CR=1
MKKYSVTLLWDFCQNYISDFNSANCDNANEEIYNLCFKYLKDYETPKEKHKLMAFFNIEY